MRTLRPWIVAIALLAGCATTESDGWTKSGMTEEQLKRDRTDCLMQARQMMPGVDGPRLKLDHPRYQRCMGERGYTMVPAK